MGFGFAVVFVLLVTTPLNNLIYNGFLKEGALAWVHSFETLNLTPNFLTFTTIAATVQVVEMTLTGTCRPCTTPSACSCR